MLHLILLFLLARDTLALHGVREAESEFLTTHAAGATGSGRLLPVANVKP